jgi:hypothetical protein
MAKASSFDLCKSNVVITNLFFIFSNLHLTAFLCVAYIGQLEADDIEPPHCAVHAILAESQKKFTKRQHYLNFLNFIFHIKKCPFV